MDDQHEHVYALLDKEISEICDFLERRGINTLVINTFRNEKMDVSAVTNASDQELLELGILTRGDRLSLRAFVKGKSKDKSETRDDKKRMLLDLLKMKGKSKKSKTDEGERKGEQSKSGAEKHCASSDRAQETLRSIQMGWLHWDGIQEKYVSVRLAKGGGTRTLKAKMCATPQDLIALGQGTFFPDGQSFFGSISTMEFTIGNFKCEEVFADFSLAKYISFNGLTRVRLYLMTKTKQVNEECQHNDFTLDNSENPKRVVTPGNLIGTSVEREALKVQQSKDYEDSLAIDRGKDEARKANDEAKKRQLRLQSARKARLPPEPSDDDNAVIVSVRHISLGVQKRAFRNTEKMCSVYDWVGSLCETPESFNLSACGLPEFKPSMEVTLANKVILNMTEADGMLSYPQEEINFIGFGTEMDERGNDTLDETLVTSVDSIPEELPEIIMEEDVQIIPKNAASAEDGRNDEPGYQFRQYSLPALLGASEMPQNVQVPVSTPDEGEGSTARHIRQITVHRLHIRHDMIKIFSDPTIISDDISVVMINQMGQPEAGDGIGVTRDVFSTFWSDIYTSLMQGEAERVPFIRHDFQKKEWEAIARILVKGYVQCQYYPLLLSKTFMAHTLFGESVISADMLINSFKKYVSRSEQLVIDRCLNGDIDANDDELLELLSTFECRILPTKDNLVQIIRELAHKELIQKPQYVSKCWKDLCENLKSFFDSAAALDQLYDQLNPSTAKVLDRIYTEPRSDAERECFKYFKRYIRGLEPSKLGKFLRFCTGAELLLFEKLEVTFTTLDKGGRRPIAHTCTPTIELPSTYQAFPELREEFDNILETNNWEMDII